MRSARADRFVVVGRERMQCTGTSSKHARWACAASDSNSPADLCADHRSGRGSRGGALVRAAASRLTNARELAALGPCRPQRC